MAEITEQLSIARHEIEPPEPQLPALKPGDVEGLGAYVLERAKRDSEVTKKALAHSREVRKRLHEVVGGMVNWVGDFTLSQGPTTTVVQDDRVTPDCEISLMPLTANAASVLQKLYVQLVDLVQGAQWKANAIGKFTVNHPVVAAADFSFRYSIKG